MTDRTPESPDPPADPHFHADPSHWEELVQAMNPAAMQVVIASAMSQQLRAQVSPEDVWQETLTHAWRDRAQHRWENASAFRSWLFEIARNRIREAVRGLETQKRGASFKTSRFSDLATDSSTSIAAGLPLESQTPSRIASRGEREVLTREALAALPPELGEIVRMHLLEELTMEVIAERLGIGVSAAWHRFRRGSEMLARILPSGTGDASSGAN